MPRSLHLFDQAKQQHRLEYAPLIRLQILFASSVFRPRFLHGLPRPQIVPFHKIPPQMIHRQELMIGNIQPAFLNERSEFLAVQELEHAPLV